ncbi:MAG: hypothetical protein ACLT98_15115, partial [Eggerthellaceae bacterium]
MGAIQSEAASTKEAREFDTAACGMCAVAKKAVAARSFGPAVGGRVKCGAEGAAVGIGGGWLRCVCRGYGMTA